MSFLFLFWHRNPSNYVIRLGDHNRHRNEGTEQNMGASRVIKHPQYDSRRINNDIALLKLSRAANINDRVLPACLPRLPGDLVGNLYSYFIYLLFTLLSTDNNHDQNK